MEPVSSRSAIPSAVPVREPKIKTTPRTPQLASLLKGGASTATSESQPVETPDEPFTEEQLRGAWDAFAEQRRKFQAEYQMLTQPYILEGSTIVVQLLSPVQETMLNNIKVELSSFLREKLRNSTIQVTGRIQVTEDKRVIYTDREKFDFLAEKNPVLRELKDRLGLDTDY